MEKYSVIPSQPSTFLLKNNNNKNDFLKMHRLADVGYYSVELTAKIGQNSLLTIHDSSIISSSILFVE